MLVTGLVGLLDVFCMASIYTATRINGWENINTYLVIYGTVFTLGPVLATSLMRTTLHREVFKGIVKRAFAITILGIGIQVIGTAILAVSTPAMQLISGTTAAASLSVYSQMIVIRWVLEVAGFALLGFMAMASLKKVNDYLVYAAFAILLLAEVMSRYLFYVMGA